jgi:hypothetical protein
MLFPKVEEVTQTWKTIVEAVISDRLGPTVKVAPDDGKDERLSMTNIYLSLHMWLTCAQYASTLKTSETKMTCFAYFRSWTTWTYSVMAEAFTTSQMLTHIWTCIPQLLTNMDYKQAFTPVTRCWLQLEQLSYLRILPRNKNERYSRTSTSCWNTFRVWTAHDVDTSLYLPDIYFMIIHPNRDLAQVFVASYIMSSNIFHKLTFSTYA